MLATGARVPAVVTGCRSYLMSDPDMLQCLCTFVTLFAFAVWFNANNDKFG